MTDEKGWMFTITGLAEEMYLAYGATTDFKNYQGLPMPEWDDLPEGITTAWEAAAKRSLEVKTVYMLADDIQKGDVLPKGSYIECPDCGIITSVSFRHITHGEIDYADKQVLVCANCLSDTNGCSHHFAEWDEEKEVWVAIEQEHWRDRIARFEAQCSKKKGA